MSPPPAGPGGSPGASDYWSKYEFGWHLSLTAGQHDAIAAVELALAEADRLAGRTDPDTGEITLVTDNGGPFRSDQSAGSSAPGPS